MSIVEEQFEMIKQAETGSTYWDDNKAFQPGTWIYQFTKLAETWEQKANSAESSERRLEAAMLYHTASVYYGLAKYPHIFATEAQDRAFEKQLENYQRSFELQGYGFERISIEFQGTTVTGFLHLPKRSSPPYPLVIGTNGLDVSAVESGPLVRDLLQRGIAVFMFDMAGTGKNRLMPLRPDFEQMYLAFVNFLRSDSRIDTSRVGAFGISFGGNAAAKLAMTEQNRFKAVANICGPIHRVFMSSPRQVMKVKPMYLDGVVDRMQLQDTNPKSIARNVRGFSLVRQALLGEGQKTKVPVLSLNARYDYVAPKSDLDLITEASTSGSIIWSGENDHCPQNRTRDMPKVAAFFEKHLSRK